MTVLMARKIKTNLKKISLSSSHHDQSCFGAILLPITSNTRACWKVKKIRITFFLSLRYSRTGNFSFPSPWKCTKKCRLIKRPFEISSWHAKQSTIFIKTDENSTPAYRSKSQNTSANPQLHRLMAGLPMIFEPAKKHYIL